jgi:predicted nucleic acid-binding protein
LGPAIAGLDRDEDDRYQQASCPPGPLEVDLQVLALGLELEGPILSDDLGLRSAASEAGLKVIGTLGILELASARKLVNLREVLIRLKQTTIRLADRFYDEALARESLRAGNR